ncbi:MAG: ABC transporter permease [Verrucomicrobiota bacterium]
MTPSLFIALRFITSRKRALGLSMIGVVCGVAFFICTQAQTQGFEKYFIETALGSRGAVEISDRFQARYTQFSGEDNAVVLGSGKKQRKYYDGVSDPYRIIHVIKTFSSVLGAAPVLEGNMSITGNFRTEIIRLQGIDLRHHLEATNLGSGNVIIAGKLDDFKTHPNAIMLGSLLAESLQVNVGDNVILTTKKETKTFTVAAIFRTGINAIDMHRGYVHLKMAQNLLNKPSMVSYIIVRLRDPERAPQISKHFERLLSHHSRSWQERESGNLQIFLALRISAALTVSLIILLAGFGIFNVLTLTVMDKVREIAILRSMGYRRRDISAIFLWQGVIIATMGSVLGWVLGAGLTFAVSMIPLKVRGIFYADHFMVHWNLNHYIYAAIIAFVAVLIASYFPARRAAKLPPVEILRGSGQ